jgi:hypothetical protein
MTPAAAAEYVLLLVAEQTGGSAAGPRLLHLTSGERELVTLVAARSGSADSGLAAGAGQ